MHAIKRISILIASCSLFYYPILWAKDTAPVTPYNYSSTQLSTNAVVVYRQNQDTFSIPRCQFGNKQAPNGGDTSIVNVNRSVLAPCCPSNMLAYVDPQITYADSDIDNPNDTQGYAIAKMGLTGTVKTPYFPDSQNPNMCNYNVQFKALMALPATCANMQIIADWNIICTPQST